MRCTVSETSLRAKNNVVSCSVGRGTAASRKFASSILDEVIGYFN
jgi:hypothetical protein